MPKSESDKPPQEDSDKKPRPVPVPKKIGEGADNLRRREEWFRKRSE